MSAVTKKEMKKMNSTLAFMTLLYGEKSEVSHEFHLKSDQPFQYAIVSKNDTLPSKKNRSERISFP